MKLLDIMKKYDRCLVRESAKLTKIYNMILRESENDSLDEEVCPDCGNDPCTCDSDEVNKDDVEMVSAEQFFSENDNDVDECGLIPEEDFIKTEEEVEENDMLHNRPHNAHIDDPAGVMNEEDIIPEEDFFAEAENSDECKDGSCDKGEMMSAEEFFAEAENSDECKDGSCDEEETMSAEEFFAESDNKDENACNEDVEKMSAEEFFTESDNDDASLDESFNEITADDMVSARELLAEKDEDDDENEDDDDAKKLQESLKSYRRKNHHLFNG